MITIELFLIDFHCHSKLPKKRGVCLGVVLQNFFYIFEAPGLHFWRFLKQIRKRIGSKLTLFYKNGYHFTKITTLLRKFYLKMAKFEFEFYLIFTFTFYLIFTVGGIYTPHTPLGRYVARNMNKQILKVWL